MNSANQSIIFDRAVVRRRRNRAKNKFAAHSVLFEETGAQLIDRLGDVKKDFQSIVTIGARENSLAEHFGKKVFIAEADFTDDDKLPCEANRFDLAVSNLSLHWINDLPGALLQIRNALKPGGLFMAALPGGDTLHELRGCLLDAELAITGGVSPRLSPTIDAPTASALLQRAGFELPVTDLETITLTYPDIFALMRDLRGMGETNAHMQRLKHFTRQALFTEAEQLYRERFGSADGRIPATFEILFLHGWKN